MQKRLTILACVLLAVMTLTACSSSKSTSQANKTTSALKPQVEGTKQAPAQYGFMQVANDSKERLWFDSYSIAKDDKLKGLYVIKNGKATYYNLGTFSITEHSGIFSIDYNLTFADIEKMSNKEIIAKAKKIDKETYLKQFESLQTYTEDFINKGELYQKNHDDEIFYEEGKASAEKVLKVIDNFKGEEGYKKYRKQTTNIQLTAMATTDASGNNVQSEKIELPKFLPWVVSYVEGYSAYSEGTYDDTDDKVVTTESVGIGTNTSIAGPVYGSYYLGFKGLVTRDFTGGLLTADVLGTDNVVEKTSLKSSSN